MSKLSDFFAERGMEQIAMENQFRQAMEQNRLAEMTHTQGYSNDVNPLTAFDNTAESIAHGIYNSPGNLARLIESMPDYSREPGYYSNPIDEFTGANYLNEEFQPESGWQKAMSFGGEMIADPSLIAGVPMGIAKGLRYGPKVLGNLSEEMARTGMRNQLGMLGGPKAKNADLSMLARAHELKAQGVDVDSIYADTQWWLDHPDGVPRFEIDDSGVVFRDDNDFRMQWGVTQPIEQSKENRLADAKQLLSEGLSEQKVYKLTGYIDRGDGLEDFYQPRIDKFTHNLLGDAYDLEKTRIEYDLNSGREGGFYSPEKDEVVIKTGEYVPDKGIFYPEQVSISNTLHELQHAIQSREGMARGGSPDEFVRYKDAIYQESKIKPLLQAYEEAEINAMRRPTKRNIAEKERLEKEYFAELAKQTELMGQIKGREPYDAYQALAGEADARLVQNRMNMSMDERLANPFYKGYDVPIEDQIIRFGDADMRLKKPR